MADDSMRLSQAEIEQLLAQTAPASTASPPSSAGSASTPDAPAASEPSPRSAATSAPPKASPSPAPELGSDIDLLFQQAEQALASINAAVPAPPDVVPFRLPEFAGTPANTESTTLDLLRDVELEVKIELGRSQMYLEDVLKLNRGAVVPLDRLAGDPVDIYVNGRLIARGEVLILNDNFCVRVAELVAGEQAVA
ncbi:MAG: flagellar motor switch protein FliN [Pirellulales bacterium]|nr:flagellar motor switch protein FliN [Pirellulales bacterium]